MLSEPRSLRCRDMRDAHIGESYWDAVVDEITVPLFRDTALRYTGDLEDTRKHGSGLYLFGANGCGKTHTMSVILKVAMEHRYSALLVTPAEIKAIKAGDVVSMQQIGAPNMLTEVAFLGIDDFCKEQYKSAADRPLFYEQAIEEILRQRAQNRLPTLFTSNTKLSTVPKYYGESVYSLLLGTTINIELNDGPDMREVIQHAEIDSWWKGTSNGQT